MSKRTSAGSQAVIAPLRRWLLHSPSRLGIVAASVIVLMLLIGQLMPGRQPGAISQAMSAEEASASTTQSEVLVKAGQEVTADEATAIDDNEAKKSPQLVAMKFALAYTDINPTTGEWITALSKYAVPGAIAGDIVADRPVVPVAVSGPTSSASRGKMVIVSTSAGDMTVRLTSTGNGWQVTTPLPTLDDVGATTPSTTETDPDFGSDVPMSTSASPSSVDSDVPTSSTSTVPDVPSALLPSTATAPPRTTTPTADSRPETGPIPTPNLEGPLPGRR